MSTDIKPVPKPRIPRKVWMVAVLASGLMLAALSLSYFRLQQDPDASFRRGLTAIGRRDVPTLHREIQILRQFPRYEPQTRLLSGAVLLATNDLQAALQQFDLCSVYPPTRIPALTLAGETFCKLGRENEAVGVLQQAITLDPKYVDAYRWLAVAHFDIGMTDEAINELLEATKLDSDDYRAYRLLGKIYKESGQNVQAVGSYQTCLQCLPPAAVRQRVLLELAQALIRLRKYDDALTFLSQADESVDIVTCRAVAQYNKGAKVESRKLGLRALAMRPGHREALSLMGTLEGEEGHFSQAAKHLEQVIKATPQDSKSRRKLAESYQKLGRSEEAQDQTKQADRIDLLRKKFAELQKQANDKPDDTDIRFQLGEVAEQLELYRVARTCYQAALSQNPEHKQAKEALESLPAPRAVEPVTAPADEPPDIE